MVSECCLFPLCNAERYLCSSICCIIQYARARGLAGLQPSDRRQQPDSAGVGQTWLGHSACGGGGLLRQLSRAPATWTEFLRTELLARGPGPACPVGLGEPEVTACFAVRGYRDRQHSGRPRAMVERPIITAAIMVGQPSPLAYGRAAA